MMLRLTRPDRPERCTASLKGREAVQPWRHKLHEVIFVADTAPGRWFDTLLIICNLISVAIAMLDSVAAISREWGRWSYLGDRHHNHDARHCKYGGHRL